jgi:hypothetical protein
MADFNLPGYCGFPVSLLLVVVVVFFFCCYVKFWKNERTKPETYHIQVDTSGNINYIRRYIANRKPSHKEIVEVTL